MSTVGVDWTQRLPDTRPRGRRASSSTRQCSGRSAPAATGDLTILASGPQEARERAQPVFDAVGSSTLWLGEAGDGTRQKLVMNFWALARDGRRRRDDRARRDARRRRRALHRADRGADLGLALRADEGAADARARLPAELRASSSAARTCALAVEAARGGRRRALGRRGRGRRRWSGRSSGATATATSQP